MNRRIPFAATSDHFALAGNGFLVREEWP